MRKTETQSVPDTEQLALKPAIEPQRIAVSRKGMVATAHYRATEAGALTLAAGGNAFDAAVAAAFALGVCEPAASGLGGQTMMMAHDADKGHTFALDGSSRAPHRATIEAFENLRAERRRGYRATTVPSTPATLGYALEKYGKLTLAKVLEPAIQLADEGFEITELQYRLTRRELKYLRKGSAAPFFLIDGHRPYRAGSVFRQPVLAPANARAAGHRRGGFMGTYTGAHHLRTFGLAVFSNFKAKLYPFPQLKRKQVVNDAFRQAEVMVAFLDDSHTATAWSRRLNGQLLTFAWADEPAQNGQRVLQDQETGSLWSPLTGAALSGQLKGQELDPLQHYPILTDRFHAFYPEGEVFK